MKILNRNATKLVVLVLVSIYLFSFEGCKTDNLVNLPDPLICEDGTEVNTPEQWYSKRRPELMKLFEEQVYGKTPGSADSISFKLVKENPDFIPGKAIMQQVNLTAFKGNKSIDMALMIVIPKNTTEAFPCFVGLNFWGNQSVSEDTSIIINKKWKLDYQKEGIVDHYATEASRGISKSRWPFELLVENGYAVITCHSGDIDEDRDMFDDGVHPLFYKEGQTKPESNEWGTIGAWAWGVSRIMDYIETQTQLDQKKVTVVGHSRLGKTALWCGAQDLRFAAVISNNSGCGGASISRGKAGETVAQINKSFPHWFCDNFLQYNDKEENLPIDQHELIALIAPRPVYIASASQDEWADPKSEFLATVKASPVYELLTNEGFSAKEMPAYNTPINGIMNYHIREGKHDITTFDWLQYIKFADQYVK